jgi:hypothetical protein
VTVATEEKQIETTEQKPSDDIGSVDSSIHRLVLLEIKAETSAGDETYYLAGCSCGWRHLEESGSGLVRARSWRSLALRDFANHLEPLEQRDLNLTVAMYPKLADMDKERVVERLTQAQERKAQFKRIQP